MPLAGHPPYRSQRAELPHWAPASIMKRVVFPTGTTRRTASRIRLSACSMVYRYCARSMFCSSGFLLADRLPSGTSAPSAFAAGLFSPFPGTMQSSDSRNAFFADLSPWSSPRNPAFLQDTFRASRFPMEWRPDMHRVSDPAGPSLHSPSRAAPFCLPQTKSGSASETDFRFRGSIPGLSGSPVNASEGPLPTHPHDSGPQWLAIPSVLDSFIPYLSMVLNGASFVLNFVA